MSNLLRNASGQIMIDRAEANADIKKLKSAALLLFEAKSKLKREIGGMESTWQGDANAAFTGKIASLYNEMERAISSIDKTITAIEKTVEKYYQIDRQLAASILGGL